MLIELKPEEAYSLFAILGELIPDEVESTLLRSGFSLSFAQEAAQSLPAILQKLYKVIHNV